MSFALLFPMHNFSSTLLREGALRYSVNPLQCENTSYDGNRGLIGLLHPRNMVLVNTGLKSPVIFLRHEVAARMPITKQVRFDFVGIEGLDFEKVEELRESRIILPEPRKLDIILPELLDRKMVWIELTKIWRNREKVKGLILNLVKGGYAVAIAGFIVFLPWSSFRKRKRKGESSKIEENKGGLISRFYAANMSKEIILNEKGAKFNKKRNDTFRRDRTFRILDMNLAKRNIVVKKVRKISKEFVGSKAAL